MRDGTEQAAPKAFGFGFEPGRLLSLDEIDPLERQGDLVGEGVEQEQL